VSDVIVVIGAGSIGQAIARRVSAGKQVLLADLRRENADAAAEVLSDAGFDVSTTTVDVSSRESVHALIQAVTALGAVSGVIHAAGVSPSQASPAILSVDLYGTALVLEEFGDVVAPGGAGVVIASQSGHRLGALSAEEDAALATTPADELLDLPMLRPDRVTDSLHAYQLSKRGNALRVMAEAVRWGQAWRAGQHDQSRHHHHSAGEGRADRAAGTGVSTDDRAVPRRPGGDAGRGRHRRGAPDGTRGGVHHRQRLPDGRWRHRRLPIRRARPR
jgi:NAD(P)-dependent dehydrogenase (short-subunit alcohol dehydrogenase family)